MPTATDSFAQGEAASNAHAEDRAPAGSAVQPCPLAKKQKLRIVLKTASLELRTGVQWKLAAGGTSYSGTTGADGLVEQQIPEAVKTATLTLATGGEPEVYELKIEAFGPVETEGGRDQRLFNLGFVDEAASGVPLAFAMDPLFAFQLQNGDWLADGNEALKALGEAYGEKARAPAESFVFPKGLLGEEDR